MELSNQKPRISILISGRGSNLQSFINACKTGELPAEICLVASNNPNAAGLKLAQDIGIATACVDHRQFETREDFDRALLNKVQSAQPELVILAGFMRILTPVFIQPFAGKLLNIHPSLLPKYRGLNTHQRALDAGDSEAGVTVHFVTAELDGGPSVLQSRVAIVPGDNADTLANRILEQEHIIYPLVASWFLQGRLKLTQDKVYFDGKAAPQQGIDYQTPQ